MNEDSFPYNKENFEDEDNKKIGQMLKWTYTQLSKEIMENDKKLNRHHSRISELENEILTEQARNSYYKSVRNYIIEIGIALGTVGLLIVGMVRLLM